MLCSLTRSDYTSSAGGPMTGHQQLWLLPQILKELLHPCKEAFALRMSPGVLAAGLFEFSQQLLLALSQIYRGFDCSLDEHVAAGGRAQHGHPLRLESELMTRLGPWRYGDPRPAAVHCRHLDRAAERCGRDRDRHATEYVRAVPLKNAMRRDGNEDVEIARGSAADPDLALTRQTDAGAVLDTGWNADRQCLFAAGATLAGASPARIIDDPSSPLACGAGSLDRKEALLDARTPTAVTGRTGDRLGASLGAAALALLAGNEGLHPNCRLLATEAVFERDLEIIPKIAAATRPSLAAPPAAHELAEHLVEDIGEPSGKAEIPWATPAALLEGGMPKAVIGGALLIVL